MYKLYLRSGPQATLPQCASTAILYEKKNAINFSIS